MRITHEIEKLRQRLPMPIAQAMGRAMEQVRPNDQMKEWRMTLEVMVGYIHAIALAEYCAQEPNSKIDEHLHKTPQQVDSKRGLMQVHSIFKRFRSNPKLMSTPFVAWFYSTIQLSGETSAVHQHLERMFEVRNDDTHSRITDAEVRAFIEQFVQLIKRCTCLQHTKLFVVREQSPTEYGVQGYVSLLMGETPSALRQVSWSGMNLYHEGVYLLRSDEQAILYLSPFLIWREDPDSRRDTLFQWRLVRKEIEYTSVLSAHKFIGLLPSVFGREADVEWKIWLENRPHPMSILLDEGTVQWELEPPVEVELEIDDSEEEQSEEGEILHRSRGWWMLCLLAVGGYVGYQYSTWQTKDGVMPTEVVASTDVSIPSIPEGIELVIDDRSVESVQPLQLTLGEHQGRMEQSGFLCHQWSFTVLENQAILEIPEWNCAGALGWSMVELPAGRFSMQGQEVTLTHGFAMMDTEVTEWMWGQVMNQSQRSQDTCLECPKTRVSWVDAIEFANRVSAVEELEPCYEKGAFKGIECKGYRLPTEAEWVYAAQAGKQTLYAGSNSPTKVAVFEWNSDAKVHPVKSKEPNDWGLYDMSGNVFEWCQDDFVEPWKGGIDPLVQVPNQPKVGKGGSFRSEEKALLLTERNSAPSSTQVDIIGLRLVRTLD